MTASTDRFLRQRDLVPHERLQGLTATVIGVGAIGRQVAIQLAALGVLRLQLIDFDSVEPTNITTQGYLHADLGRPKVDATASLLWQIEPKLHVETVNDRFRPQHVSTQQKTAWPTSRARMNMTAQSQRPKTR